MASDEDGPREPAGDDGKDDEDGRGRAPDRGDRSECGDRIDRIERIRSRARGCLLAGALGDALGAPIEFMPWPMIRVLYGERGLDTLAPAYGRLGAITDDTQMTLFTAEGLIRAFVRGKSRGIGNPASVVHHAYLRWLHTQGIPWKQAGRRFAENGKDPDGWLVRQEFLYARRAPGNTCLGALERPLDSELFARNDSKGCGGVMRVAPVGLLPHPGTGGERVERDGIFRLAVECAALTHGHPSGQLPAGVLAATIHGVVHEGESLGRSLDEALRLLRARPRHEETLAAVVAARDLAERGEPTPEKLHTLGSGWVAEEALAIALYAALGHERDPRGGLLAAVNHSGDSDSTGAICGNLLGAVLGEEALPEEWLRHLEGRDVIARIADDLVDEAFDLRPQEDGDDPAALQRWQAWFNRYPGW